LREYVNHKHIMGLVTYGSDAFEHGLINVGEDVGLWVAENLEGYGAVMVLKWRYVVVADCKVRACVYLITNNKYSTATFLCRLQSDGNERN